MDLLIRTLIVLVLVLSMSCGPKPLTVPDRIPRVDMPEHPGYRDAERAFENERYAEALDGFNAFLRDVPDGRYVDVALYRVGTIFRRTGQDEDALAVFFRLRNEFPGSKHTGDAQREILQILFETERYASVLRNGARFVAATADDRDRGPLFLVMANAHKALGQNLDAAIYYHRTWQAAADTDKPEAWTRFTGAVEGLDPPALEELLRQADDPRVEGTLLYRLAMAFLLAESYDQAMDAFKQFVQGFPDHPDHADAVNMIETLAQRERFIPFTIGCVVPLSGPYALYGRRVLNGIELALDHAFATADGIPFTILIRDSRSDADTAIKAVDLLDRDRVGAILGPMAASQAAAERAQANGIPIFPFTQREAIPDVGPYVFRNFITPQMQVRALVSFAMEALDVRRFAVLYPEENYGRRYMNLFWDQVIEQGGVVTGVEAYDPKGTDFAQPIKKLTGIFYDVPKDLILEGLPKKPFQPLGPDSDSEPIQPILDPVERVSGIPLSRPAIDQLGRRHREEQDQWHPIVDFDAVFIPDAPKKAGLAIPQLAYYDIRDVYLLGTNLWHSKTLVEMSGQYMKQTLIVDGFFAHSTNERVQTFVAAFMDTFQRAPGIIEAVAYDTAMMMFETMRNTATDSRRELKDAFLQVCDYQGITGETAFLPNGEADKQLTMLRIQGGQFVEIQRIAPSEPEIEDSSVPQVP